MRHPRLPLRITLLLGLVLIVTVLSLVRALTAAAWSPTLQSYLFPGEVYYIEATGALWFLVGASILWLFWLRLRWTRWLLLAGAVLYAGWSWLDRLVVQGGPGANWPFALLVTAVFLGYTAFVVLDPRNRLHFGREMYERKPEDTESA